MASTSASKSNGTGPSTADLAEQVAQIKGDMGELTTLLKDLGLSKAEAAQDAIKSGVATGKQKGEDAIALAQLQAEHAGAKAQQFVHEQPTTALGIAAGVGFLVGLLATRRA